MTDPKEIATRTGNEMTDNRDKNGADTHLPRVERDRRGRMVNPTGRLPWVGHNPYVKTDPAMVYLLGKLYELFGGKVDD